jgi:hypothetical protein
LELGLRIKSLIPAGERFGLLMRTAISAVMALPFIASLRNIPVRGVLTTSPRHWFHSSETRLNLVA